MLISASSVYAESKFYILLLLEHFINEFAVHRLCLAFFKKRGQLRNLPRFGTHI
jgi:hypothetical protein